MPRRVLVLNHFAVPDGAAGGTRHIEMFGSLSESWSVTIVAADRNLLDRQRTSSPDRRFRFVRTTPYGANGPARVINWVSYAIGALVAGMVEPRPSVVYASSPHLLAGLSGWAIARLRGAAFVLEIRDLWPLVLVEMGHMSRGSLVYRLLQALERHLYRSADAIVVLAEGSEPAIRRSVGLSKRIEFIPNGADNERFGGVEPDQHVDRMTFLYAGAHGPANGLHLLLDAAHDLGVDLPTATVELVGDGVAKDELVRRAKRGMLTNVSFLDAVPKSDMPAVLATVQVGLHVLADVPLFRFGVSPNKLFEYMAAGLPVITNTPGEVADIVRAAGAGLSTEPDGLSAAMCLMAAMTPEEREAMGSSGRRWVTANRSRSRLALQLEVLLDAVSRGGSG